MNCIHCQRIQMAGRPNDNFNAHPSGRHASKFARRDFRSTIRMRKERVKGPNREFRIGFFSRIRVCVVRCYIRTLLMFLLNYLFLLRNSVKLFRITGVKKGRVNCLSSITVGTVSLGGVDCVPTRLFHTDVGILRSVYGVFTFRVGGRVLTSSQKSWGAALKINNNLSLHQLRSRQPHAISASL